MRTIQWITVLFSFFVLVAATLYADPCPSLNVKQFIKLPDTLEFNKIKWDTIFNIELTPEEQKYWKMVGVSMSKFKEAKHYYIQNELGQCCYYKLDYQRGDNVRSRNAYGILILQEPTEPK